LSELASFEMIRNGDYVSFDLHFGGGNVRLKDIDNVPFVVGVDMKWVKEKNRKFKVNFDRQFDSGKISDAMSTSREL
jgi:hypothetical protein